MTTNEELRARAEALPREQWHVGTRWYAREVRRGAVPTPDAGMDTVAWVGMSDDDHAHAHAAYIAAASPDVILRLLDENAQLRAGCLDPELQQSMLQLEWQRGYDEGLSDGMNK